MAFIWIIWWNGQVWDLPLREIYVIWEAGAAKQCWKTGSALLGEPAGGVTCGPAAQGLLQGDGGHQAVAGAVQQQPGHQRQVPALQGAHGGQGSQEHQDRLAQPWRGTGDGVAAELPALGGVPQGKLGGTLEGAFIADKQPRQGSPGIVPGDADAQQHQGRDERQALWPGRRFRGRAGEEEQR